MGKLLGGHYQFIQVLGSTDFSQTYLAADVRITGHPKCVVKRYPFQSANSRSLQFMLNLFYQKAKILEEIAKHDKIPKILNYFSDRDAFYLVQEFVPGHPLTAEMQPGYCLPESQVVYFLQEILEILAFAHKHGAIHRSIKPSNIIRRHPDGKVLLVDFALVKEIPLPHAENNTASSEDSIYTPLEQAEGQVHCSSDLYALGMTAIQALTGLSKQGLAVRKRAVETEYKSCDVFWPRSLQLHPQLRDILNKMVHPDLGQRYADATLVLADLDAIRHGQPLARAKATPISPPLAATPRRRSYKYTIAALAIVGIMAMAIAAKVPQRLATRYWLHAAQTSVATGDDEAAIAAYTHLLHQHPDRDRLYFQRGMAYLRLSDSTAALADFTAAIKANPNYAEAYYQRGNIRLNLGDPHGANRDYNEAIVRDPNLVNAYVNRGSTHAALGDEQAAIDDYNEAIARDPDLAAAYLNRCLSYSNLGDQEAAIADCTQAINLRPNHTYSYQNRGLAYYRQQNWQKAIEDYNIAIQLDSSDAEPYYNRGLTRAKLGDWSGAIADYTSAIERSPHHLFAYYDRGLAYVQHRDRDAARADFQTAATICLDAGKLDCYNDALYQIQQLE
jgi:serine/threonine protein kinase/Tfp pilus assembly protein PilF